jgi:hypothetical protein
MVFSLNSSFVLSYLLRLMGAALDLQLDRSAFMARPYLTWCKAQAFDTMTSTALVTRFLSLPPLPFTPENAWLTLPVPDAWDLALRMLPGVRHLSTASLLIYMNGRLAPSTRVSYSSTWSVFIHFINERYLHAQVPWHVWITHMVSMHQAFCVHYLHSHALFTLTCLPSHSHNSRA